MFKIDVASVEDREALVAELWWDEQQVAELSQEGGRLRLQIYRPSSGKYWEFDYVDFARAVTDLHLRLKGS